MTPENPFTPLPTPESILETLGFTEALRRLGENLGAREPFLLITGEPGMGKTTLAQLAIARWGSRAAVARLAMPLHTGVELLEEILHRLGAEFPESASRPKLAARLELLLGETVVRQQVAVIVVDDAHHLSSELLEELRLLVSAAQQAGCRIEVLLLGPPALEERLEQPALAPLRQRVSVRAHLAPLSAGEARRYIRHRLAAAGLDGAKIFPRKTCAEIAAQSCGVPREINALAAEALRVARAAGSAAVEPSHVREALATLSGALPKGDAEDAAEIAETVAEALVVVKSEPRKTAPAAAPPSAVFAVPPVGPAVPGAPAPAAPAVTPTPAPPVAKASATPADPPVAKAAAARVEVPVAKAAAARVEVPVAKASATPADPPVTKAAAARVEAPVTKAAATRVEAPVAKAAATPVDPPVARPAPAATVPPPGDPSRVRDSVPGDEEFSKPTPAPPANYTPSEWVARFVGDKGPLQLASHGAPRETRSREFAAPIETPAAEAGEASPKPAQAAGAAPRSARRRRSLRVPIAAAAATIVVFVAIGLIVRVIGIARTHGAPPAAATASVSPTGDQESSARAPSGGATRGAGATRATEPREPSPAAGPIPKGPYTLDTNALLGYTAALDERSRTQSLTGIEGWVAPAGDDHPDQYRVLLGIFSSYSRAQSAAAMLMRSHTLSHVTVVKLPSRRVRQ